MKQLTLSLRKSGGRNMFGRICSFHIGGGHKQRYRVIDLKRASKVPILIRTIEKDPNRSAYISLVLSEDGVLSYILATDQVRLGDILVSSNKYAVMTGATMIIRDIPLGCFIHNVSDKGKNSLIRAAGCYGQVLKKTFELALIKLPSGKRIKVPLSETATIGKLSNPKHFYREIHKAGRTRWLGKTSIVRGVAMNPVDHPMGGKTHGKLHKTPWGKLAKGVKTKKKINGI